MADEIYTFDKAGMSQVLRMLRDHQREITTLKHSIAHITTRTAHNQHFPQEPPVPFKNNSGETMPAYGVGRPTALTKSSGDPFVQISKPSSTFSPWYLVNNGQDVPNGAYGLGYWLASGGIVKYSTGTPAFGEEWGPTSGDWGLVKNRPGFWVQGAAIDTTNKWIKAMQSEVTTLIGQTDSSHAKSASGTVSVYCGTAGSESDTGMDITAYNLFAAVGSGKKVACALVHGNWYLIAAEC